MNGGRRTLLLLLAAALPCGAGELSRADQAAMQTAKKVEKSIAAVIIRQGKRLIGISGVVIHPKGYVLTLRSPFADKTGALRTRSASLAYPGMRTPVDAEIVHDDEKTQTVLLKTTGKLKVTLKALRARPSDEIEKGEWVLLVGNLLGTRSDRETSVSMGVISGIRRNGKTTVEIHASTNLNPGTLGAPVVDLRGNLIGITAPRITDAGGQAVLMPWDRLAEQYGAVKGEIGRMFKPARSVTRSPALPEAFSHVVRAAARKGAAALVGVRAGAPTEATTQPLATKPNPRVPKPVPGELAAMDRSSGVIVGADGWIVCPLRVTGWPGPLRKLVVDFRDGSKAKATRVGYDERLRIALLKVEVKDLPLLPHVPASDIRQGRFAIALGYPHESPQHQTPLVTFGLVSRTGALGHIHPAFDALQTDAGVAGGNRGGPLLDIEGRLMGVLLDINDTDVAGYGPRLRGRYGANCGLGFAIPIGKLTALVKRMSAGGVLQSGFFGVSIVAVEGGLRVVNLVEKNSGGVETASAAAGIKKDDIIVSLAGEPMKDARVFRRTLAGLTVGDAIEVVFLRDGKEQRRTVTLTGR